MTTTDTTPRTVHPLSSQSDDELTDATHLVSAQDWEQKAQEYLLGWQRAKADYQNLKKDLLREREEFAKFAAIDLIRDILEVYSNLNIAEEHVPVSERSVPWVVGFSHITKQFFEVLKARGVSRIATVGTLFDPHFHEAVEGINESEGKPVDFQGTAAFDERPMEQIILKEVKPGFLLYGQVLCPAKVVVASVAPAANQDGTPDVSKE